MSWYASYHMRSKRAPAQRSRCLGLRAATPCGDRLTAKTSSFDTTGSVLDRRIPYGDARASSCCVEYVFRLGLW
jgi:hypothetical protein